MKQRYQRLSESLRTGFWAVPALCVVLAVALAVGLVAVDRRLGSGGGLLRFGAGPDGAREVLSAITTSMITFTGLVFSITIVVLQLTSSQFSPRVLRTFLRDRQTQLSLGVFIATFVYAVMVLRSVSSVEDAVFVPAVSTTVGVGLLLLSVGVFVGYIHHVATSIQVSSILAAIAAETTDVLDERLPSGCPLQPEPLRPTGRPSLVVPAQRAGVVTSRDEARLVRLASAAGVVLSSAVPAGGFVPQGAPLLEVHGDPAQLDVRAVVESIVLGRDRTMQQDVAFGFRQLADICAKALSPGVNDPTTAVQGLDALHDLLRRMVTRHLPSGGHQDDAGVLRLALPSPRLHDYLVLALSEADQYGADSAQVQERIDSLLTDLRSAALPEHRVALEAFCAARAARAARS